MSDPNEYFRRTFRPPADFRAADKKLTPEDRADLAEAYRWVNSCTMVYKGIFVALVSVPVVTLLLPKRYSRYQLPLIVATSFFGSFALEEPFRSRLYNTKLKHIEQNPAIYEAMKALENTDQGEQYFTMTRDDPSRAL